MIHGQIAQLDGVIMLTPTTALLYLFFSVHQLRIFKQWLPESKLPDQYLIIHHYHLVFHFYYTFKYFLSVFDHIRSNL